MAAIVNTRDLLLQAADPRVLPVFLPPNVTVPQGQVDGLPLIVENSKVIYLRPASQIFQISKAEVVSPESIMIEPVVRNVVGSALWEVIAGTATLTNETGGSKSLHYADMGTDSVSIKLTIEDTGINYTDTITIVKLREGSDSINALLSNESHTLSASSAGVVSSYSGAGTTMVIYIGTADTTGSWTFSRTNSSGVSSTLASNSVSVTAFADAEDTGYVDITAARAGYTNITKRFSLGKSKAGVVGTNGDRGAGHFYASGASWSDVTADSTTPGLNVISDRVTISSGSFVMTKYWTGSAWTPDGTVIDGNLIVTNSITASQINTNGLTIRDGLGNIIFSSSVDLAWGRINPISNLAALSGTENIDNALVSLSGLGFTGALDATKNTGAFATLSGTITSANAATYFAANSLSGTYIANLAANKILAGTLVAGVIYAGDIAATQITAGTLAAGVVYAGNLSANNITSGTINTASIVVPASGGGDLLNVGYNGTTVSYRLLSGYNISCGNLMAPSTSTISASNVSGGSVPCITASGASSSGVYASGAASSAGYVGYSGGYDFYAAGGATNYGPFTGAHDALWVHAADTDVEVGDIMVDVECIARGGLSNTLFEVEGSSAPLQKTAIGILAHKVGNLSDHKPAVFITLVEGIRPDWTPTLNQVISDQYHEIKQYYKLGAVNALGEGQMNVCGEGGDIKAGDFIVTSSIRGKGMKQGDDLMHNYTVARARESVSFESSSQVKQVACIYLCG